jgi:hypothetical protein
MYNHVLDQNLQTQEAVNTYNWWTCKNINPH